MLESSLTIFGCALRLPLPPYLCPNLPFELLSGGAETGYHSLLVDIAFPAVLDRSEGGTQT